MDGAAFETLPTSDFSYDPATKTAAMSFAKIAAGLADKAVTIKVVYAGAEKTASFTVAGRGVVYYVDSVNGNDSFDGQSPETAFRTIERSIPSSSCLATSCCSKRLRVDRRAEAAGFGHEANPS
ncbi:MAG: hypothetical protein ACLSAP_02535 [Oscillospiraceae bacterium]